MEKKGEVSKEKIYVGNLPLSLEDEDLGEIFSAYGDILEAKVQRDDYYKRSKGFGFVTYTSKAEAKKAIDEMNGEEFQGRKLSVKFFEAKK